MYYFEIKEKEKKEKKVIKSGWYIAKLKSMYENQEYESLVYITDSEPQMVIQLLEETDEFYFSGIENYSDFRECSVEITSDSLRKYKFFHNQAMKYVDYSDNLKELALKYSGSFFCINRNNKKDRFLALGNKDVFFKILDNFEIVKIKDVIKDYYIFILDFDEVIEEEVFSVDIIATEL